MASDKVLRALRPLGAADVEGAYPVSGVIVSRLRPNDEILSYLTALAKERSIRAALIAGIGGLRHLEVGVFKGGSYDVASYEAGPGETIELTSLLGTLAIDGSGSPSPHIHVTASLPNHQPVSGHLIKGVVGPLVELYVISLEGELWRLNDPSIGLPALFAGRRPS